MRLVSERQCLKCPAMTLFLLEFCFAVIVSPQYSQTNDTRIWSTFPSVAMKAELTFFYFQFYPFVFMVQFGILKLPPN